MIALFGALGLVLLIFALTAAIRGSRRRAAEFETALHEVLRQRLGGDLVITEQRLSLVSGGDSLLRTRLVAAARAQPATEVVVAAACAVLRRALRPLAGSLSLKIHGTRVGLHFVSPTVLELTAPEPRLARRPEPDLGLVATYRIDGRSDQCVSEDHLREQAIDTADLHGIALAVLRQRFDEALVARVVGGAREIVESQDGTAATLLFALPDFLPSGARVAAVLESPDRLVLEPWSENAGPAAGNGLALAIDARGWKVL